MALIGLNSWILNPALLPVIIVLLVWSMIWKGIALWKAGRNNQLAWFVVMLIVNTVGILEIIYLAFFQKREMAERKRRR